MGLGQARYRIEAGTADVTAAIADRLEQLTLSDEREAYADTLQIELDDRAPYIASPRRGVVLTVSIGIGDQLSERGRFTVDEIERLGPDRRLVIHAQATNVLDQLKQQRTAVWEDTTVSQVVSDVATRHGLEARVASTLAGHSVARLDQTNESDLALLQRLGREHQTQPKITDRYIIFVPKGAGRTASDAALAAIALSPRDVTTWHASTQDRGRHGSVAARWHSSNEAKDVTEVAGSGLPRKTLTTVYETASRARDAARSELTRLNRGTGPLRIAMPARPDLRAETPIRLSQFGPDVDGDWVIDNLRETLDKSGGWAMSFDASPPA